MKVTRHQNGTPLSTEELLRNIDRNDRRFRVAQGIFMAVVAAILIGLLGAQYTTIQRFQEQSVEQRNGFEKIQRATQDSVDQQKQYIHCIAQFFATTDRTSHVITDLESCSISTEPTPATAVTYAGEPGPAPYFRTIPETPSPPAASAPTPAPSTAPQPTSSPTPTPTPAPCRLNLLGICLAH